MSKLKSHSEERKVILLYDDYIATDKISIFPFLPTKRDRTISIRAVYTRLPTNVIAPPDI